MNTELIESLGCLKGWDDLHPNAKFDALQEADLFAEVGLEGWDRDSAEAEAEDNDYDHVEEMFLTDPDDGDSLCYLIEDIEDMTGADIRAMICQDNPDFTNDEPDFESWLSVLPAQAQRAQLTEIAANTQNDLASPEQALSRRSRGRFM